MAGLAERTRGRKRGAPRPSARIPAHCRRRATLSAGLAAVAQLAALAAPAVAQQTGIDGSPAGIGPGAGGLVVNNEVLENLGPGPEVPALPYQVPGFMSEPAVGVETGTEPGIAYRQSEPGQLLVTQPVRLLFPPPRAPRGRLAAEAPGGPTALPELELTSRLLVAPAPHPMTPAPVERAVETAAAAAETLAPPPAPVPLEPRAAAQLEPAPPESAVPEPSQAAEAPPALSALAAELLQSTAPAQPGQNSTAKATAEPAPPPEPAIQLAASPPEPMTPAPAAAETGPPPPPAKSLTARPAVEPQIAALPLALAEQIRVLFQDGSIELSDDARRRLSAAAIALQENTTMRVQLLAYANANTDGARRLSLSRALAVRAYLIERGVRSTRMDVRALGDKIGDGPADRVDILPEAAN